MSRVMRAHAWTHAEGIRNDVQPRDRSMQVIQRVLEKRQTQTKAASLLGLSMRQVKRLGR
jgi:hypothetical protein